MFVSNVVLFLKDLVFYFTPGVRPCKSVLVAMVLANGGRVADSLYQLNSEVNKLQTFLRATAGTAIARLSHRNSVCPSVCPSVRHTGGSGKNGAS